MATIRQKNLAREIVNNMKADKPKNKKELVVSSGYSEISAESSASIIIDQKGVKDELKILGFTEEKAKSVVASIMNNSEIEPNARLKAADMTFKVHGSYAPEKTQALNVSIKADIKDISQIEALRLKYEEELKGKLIQ